MHFSQIVLATFGTLGIESQGEFIICGVGVYSNFKVNHIWLNVCYCTEQQLGLNG